MLKPIILGVVGAFGVVACGGETNVTEVPGTPNGASNNPPNVTSAASVVAEELFEVVYVMAASDPDQDPVTLRIPILPAWLSLSGDTVSGRPQIGESSTSFTVIASDGKLADTLEVAVEVRMPANYPPLITSAARANAEELLGFSYVATAVDADGGAPTIALSGLPFWASASGDTVTGTPPRGAASSIIKVVASDGQFTDSLLVSVNVKSLNGEIQCKTDFGDPALSEYVLPYTVGRTFMVRQGNCFPNGGHNNWFAYDFDTPMGEAITASRTGIVRSVQNNFPDSGNVSGQENTVWVTHSDGTIVRYTHLMQGTARVAVGDSVFPGDTVGLSGNSGATGGTPHLHIALFKAGTTSFGRTNSLPMNFSNADGPHDSLNQLIMGSSYTALP